jgi:threonyl-tRNA synthetase
MIEDGAGKFPLWLSPVQAVVCTITNDAEDYAREVHAALDTAGIRAQLDVRAEKINSKIRDHSLQKVPLILVVGKKEAEGRSVALRRLGGEAQEMMSLADAVTNLVVEATPPDLRKA